MAYDEQITEHGDERNDGRGSDHVMRLSRRQKYGSFAPLRICETRDDLLRSQLRYRLPTQRGDQSPWPPITRAFHTLVAVDQPRAGQGECQGRNAGHDRARGWRHRGRPGRCDLFGRHREHGPARPSRRSPRWTGMSSATRMYRFSDPLGTATMRRCSGLEPTARYEVEMSRRCFFRSSGGLYGAVKWARRGASHPQCPIAEVFPDRRVGESAERWNRWKAIKGGRMGAAVSGPSRCFLVRTTT